MITPMKKILLAGRAKDRERILNILRNTEIVHVEPIDASSVSIPQKLATDIENCKKAISVIRKTPPVKDTIAAPGAPFRVIKEILEHNKSIPLLESRLTTLSRKLEQLVPWGDLGADDIDILEKNNVKIHFLTASSDKLSSLDELENFTYSIIDDQDNRAILIIAASNKPVEIPDCIKVLPKPDKSWSEVSEEIDATKKEIFEHKKSLNELALRKNDLEKFLSELLNKKRFSEVETGTLTDDTVFFLSGWCPANEVEKFQKTFEETGVSVGIQFEEPEEGEQPPPTKLTNSGWVSTIGHLYDFMGVVPSYNEPDTSSLFLSTLIVFSAFLLADAGYGLVIVLAILAGYKPLTNRGVEKGVLNLILFLFGGVTIYGVLTNTYFGEFTFKIDSFDPNSDSGTAFLQGICFLMGTSHLTVAHIIKAKNKKRDVGLLSDLGWIIFLWAMYSIICNLVIGKDFIVPGKWAIPMFKVSLPLILFFTAPSWNIPVMLGKGLGAILQNASACFSDIVSYIRLWAVGLAGGKVAGAFNNIAAMLPHIVLRLPVWIVGHGINIILGSIAILAHGVRLNLLEFSNHLELEWAGRKYDPFKEIK